MSTTDISLNDINLTCEIIKICSKRGAFTAEELEEIGKLYNKFNKIIKDQIELQKKNTISNEIQPTVNTNENKNL